jgi:hypothetical protein
MKLVGVNNLPKVAQLDLETPFNYPRFAIESLLNIRNQNVICLDVPVKRC